MPPTRYWITSIGLDAAVATLVIAAAQGNTLASGLMLALVWSVIVGRIAVAITGTSENGKDRPAGFIVYHVLAETALIVGLWAAGYPITAAVYLVALIGFELALLREPAPTEGTEGALA